MVVTKSFKRAVERRVAADPAFVENMLRESVQYIVTGPFDGGRRVLRDYIKATIGYERLSEGTNIPAKSLIRMFSLNGNPTARNLFRVIVYLQEQAGLELRVSMQPR